MVHLIIALKGPAVTETVEFLLPGSFSACMLSLARLSGNVRPRWHSQHIIRRYRRCSGVRFCRTICARIKNSPKAASTSAFNVFRFFRPVFCCLLHLSPVLSVFRAVVCSLLGNWMDPTDGACTVCLSVSVFTTMSCAEMANQTRCRLASWFWLAQWTMY